MRPDPDDREVLPERSDEESGLGWGEAPEPDDDERLRQERPPHWDQYVPRPAGPRPGKVRPQAAGPDRRRVTESSGTIAELLK
jgi:hypothetical protein